MNDQLRTLVRQAVVAVDIVTGNEALDDELAKMYIPDCFAEKFAELIVRECMSIIKQGEGLGEEDDFDKGFQAGIAMAYNRVRTQMRVEKND